MPSQKKIDIVSSLVDKLKSAPNFVLVAFDNIPHVKFEELRKNLTNKVSLNVVKNSLLKVAASKLKKSDVFDDQALRGNSAIMTLPEEWMESLATFYKFSKSEGNISFKLGIIDQKVYDKDQLVKLAMLPPYEQLIASIIGSLRSPQTRLVYAMKYPMSKLVYILKNVKGGD